MIITKESIFDLLGGDNRRYHSCVATTYSFDFSFFEIHAIRAFKSTGIRNTLVLIDEGNLTELMENPTGYEFTRNLSYGIYPISAKGVFHPKLIFCAGKKEGFIAIGSGNLTNSGHGSNDELWSVFHYKEGNSDTAPIFSQVWQYILTLNKHIKGNSKEKIFRLLQNAPWINELKTNNEYASLKQEKVRLLPVFENENKLNFIKQQLNEIEVETINILSPYFDKDGNIIQQLKSQYPMARINVVMDIQHGLLPYNLDTSGINIYDWSKVNETKENDLSRLHGKLISFEIKGGEEYILQGSSNATSAALGCDHKNSKNQELNIWLHSIKKDTILNRLGIYLNDDARINFEDINEKENQIQSYHESLQVHFPVKIKCAELEENILTLYTEIKEPSTFAKLLYIDRDGQQVGNSEEIQLEEKITTTLNTNTAFICVWHDEEKQISNKIIIQNSLYHHTSNPDKESEKYEAIMDNIQHGHFGQVGRLLSYVSFNREISTGSLKEQNYKDNLIIKNKENNFKTVDSYKEFTSVSEQNLLKQKGLLNNPSIRIAEFLSAVKKRQLILNEESESQEQITNIDNYDGDEDDKLPKIKAPKTFDACKTEQRGIQQFINKHIKQLNQTTSKLLGTASRMEIEKLSFSIVDLSNMLITLQLTKHYSALLFDFNMGETSKKEAYLKLTGKKKYTNLQNIVNHSVGMFLILMNGTTPKIEFETLKRKLGSFRKEVVNNLLFVLCNINWQKREGIRDVTIANVLMIRLLDSSIDNTNLLCEIKKGLDDIAKEEIHRQDKSNNQPIYKSRHFIDNLLNFEDILTRVDIFAKQVLANTKNSVSVESVKVGEWIYNGVFGISLIEKKLEGKVPNQRRLKIANLGFFTNNDKCLRTESYSKVILVN
jgi:hypothetical protein